MRSGAKRWKFVPIDRGLGDEVVRFIDGEHRGVIERETGLREAEVLERLGLVVVWARPEAYGKGRGWCSACGEDGETGRRCSECGRGRYV